MDDTFNTFDSQFLDVLTLHYHSLLSATLSHLAELQLWLHLIDPVNTDGDTITVLASLTLNSGYMSQMGSRIRIFQRNRPIEHDQSVDR